MTFAVDFDGTLFSDGFPEVGKPIWKVINTIKQYKAAGHTIILWTCRVGKALLEAVEACREVGIVFDFVNENNPEFVKMYGSDCRKICADVYIDDRAYNPTIKQTGR